MLDAKSTQERSEVGESKSGSVVANQDFWDSQPSKHFLQLANGCGCVSRSDKFNFQHFVLVDDNKEHVSLKQSCMVNVNSFPRGLYDVP